MSLAAFQDLSLGILLGGARSTITADVTLTTAGGGLPNDFSSVRLAWIGCIIAVYSTTVNSVCTPEMTPPLYTVMHA